MLIERQPHQGLDAGQEDASALLGILGLERELPGLCGHELPLGGPQRLEHPDDGHIVVGKGISGNTIA